MDINFNFLQDTIDINKYDMSNSSDATNDMLVDDILIELGYNRKRDPNVKRLYNSDIDWSINHGEKLTNIRVKPYGAEINEDTIKIPEDADIFIETNGVDMLIVIKNGDKNISLNLLNLSDSDKDILNDLSKDTFNYENLKKTVTYKLITEDKLKNTIENEDVLRDIYNIVVKNTDIDDIEENFELIRSLLAVNNGEIMETNDGSANEVTELKEYILKANKTIAKLEDEITRLRETEHKETIELSSEQQLESEKEIKYIKQIEQLHKDKSNQQDEIDELKETIIKLEKRLDAEDNNLHVQAEGLLAEVEDDIELPRSYVGVVNSSLFQEDSLNRFVGHSIEKLYEVEGFNIMPLIFDGDLFKIKQNGNRVDFLINTKEYEVNLEDETEDSVLDKLDTLFSKFDKTVFKCKAIGTLEEIYDEIEDSSDVIGDDYQLDDIFDDADVDIELDESELLGDNIDNYTEEQTTERVSLVVKIAKISEVFWNNYVKNIEIKGIAIGNKKYSINSDDDLEIQLSKIIDALLTNTNNFENTVKTLIQKDFNGVSIAIKEMSTGLINIPFTRFGIDKITNVGMIVPIINEFLESIEIDRTNVEMYIKADIPIDSTINKYAVDFGDIQEYTNEHQCSLTGQTGSLIISGNITDMALMNSGVTNMYNKILVNCLAVKTNYLQERLDTIDGRARVFENIINKFNGDKLGLANALGTVIGTNYKIMSTDKSEVSPDYYEIKISGKAVYVSELSPFELTFTLIRLHSYIQKNKSIGIQVEIDLGAYNFYRNTFVDTDARRSLSVYTVVNYINTRIKQ